MKIGTFSLEFKKTNLQTPNREWPGIHLPGFHKEGYAISPHSEHSRAVFRAKCSLEIWRLKGTEPRTTEQNPGCSSSGRCNGFSQSTWSYFKEMSDWKIKKNLEKKLNLNRKREPIPLEIIFTFFWCCWRMIATLQITLCCGAITKEHTPILTANSEKLKRSKMNSFKPTKGGKIKSEPRRRTIERTRWDIIRRYWYNTHTFCGVLQTRKTICCNLNKKN